MHHAPPKPVPAGITDDPAARAALREATAHNYHLPPDFGGFAAELRFRDGARGLAGSLSAPTPRTMQLELPEASEDDLRWLRMELGSMIGHRLALDFEQGDGRYVLTFGPEEQHPFGRLIHLHGDPYDSSYRVAEGQLREVNRSMSGQRFTINIHAALLTPSQQYLSTHYSAAYFSQEEGRLIRADAYTDDYAEVGGVWLPRLRRVVTADDSGLRVREFELRDHRLLNASATPSGPAQHTSTRAIQDARAKQ